MFSGTTRTGFAFEVEEDTLNDMELLEGLNAMETNVLAIPMVCEKILGKEGKKALYEHLRQEDGRIPVDAATEEIKDMFVAFGKAGKNS